MMIHGFFAVTKTGVPSSDLFELGFPTEAAKAARVGSRCLPVETDPPHSKRTDLEKHG